MGRRLLAAFICAAFVVACAKAIVDDGVDSGTNGSDAATDVAIDNAACPQFDLSKDPQHCGTCTHACSSGEVCSAGACKAQCDTSLQKCTGADAAVECVDIKTDIDHCGTCTTKCGVADAGSLAPGTNNPDAGVAFDGGYDGGSGWSLGTASCEAGSCEVTCPSGMQECADGICYDPQNFHDHCGDCNTACASTEWCGSGHCCAQGSEWCGSSCVDVTTDNSNCGTCGHACSGGTPVCSAGVCTAAVTYSQSFTQSVVASSQCTAWNTWRASLTGTYTSVTLSGSNDSTGRTCTGSTANTICQGLHNGTAVSGVSCGGYTWYVDYCSSMTWELSADGTACTCTNPGYNVRPCISSNGDWGGITTTSCSAPSQTITVSCK